MNNIETDVESEEGKLTKEGEDQAADFLISILCVLLNSNFKLFVDRTQPEAKIINFGLATQKAALGEDEVDLRDILFGLLKNFGYDQKRILEAVNTKISRYFEVLSSIKPKEEKENIH